MERDNASLGAFARARPGIVSLSLGLICACGYPPFHAWWIALPALGLVVVHLHSAPNLGAVLSRAYLFGWAHLTLANNWIATAFTHQTKMPEFLGWVAVPLLCLYLAVYPALAALAARLLCRRADLAIFGLMFAAAWIATEWLRSWAFTGYPWPPLGLMLLGAWDRPGLAAILPWTGTYVLSGLTLLIAVLLVAACRQRAFAIALPLGFGIVAAMLWPARATQDTGIRYALIQPLITQDEINDASKFEDQFQRIAELTSPGRDDQRLVLWPESAIPDYLEDGYPLRYYRQTYAADPAIARRRIASTIGPDALLLTGVVNLDIGINDLGVPGAVSARNSVLALNGEGDVKAHYAKAHLVPFGEYLPARWALEPLGLDRLVEGTIDYRPGPSPDTLDLGSYGRAGIQICYEIVFSGEVVDRSDRPDYIFNPSIDGWFGTWGPPQHLAQARLRAIEEGLPVLRSTTTGISAVIDANGVVSQTIASGKAGRLDGFVPQAHAPTWFATYGHLVTFAWFAILALLAVSFRRLLALQRARS